MTEQSEQSKTKIQNLELNKETLQDLTEERAEAVRGGGDLTGALSPSKENCDPKLTVLF
jgi:hypothetical protein